MARSSDDGTESVNSPPIGEVNERQPAKMFDLTMFMTENGLVQIAQLRKATEGDHAAVEGSFSLLSDKLSVREYLNTLERMYGFIHTWELLAENLAPSDLLPLVQARARRDLLWVDIAGLQGNPPLPVTAPMPAVTSRSKLLGALYVMEGSRLGGQLLARHVESVLDLRDGLGTAYFRGFGDRTGSMWKELLQVLETEIPDTEAELAIATARQMFQAFGGWMRSDDPISATELTRQMEEFRRG